MMPPGAESSVEDIGLLESIGLHNHGFCCCTRPKWSAKLNSKLFPSLRQCKFNTTWAILFLNVHTIWNIECYDITSYSFIMSLSTVLLPAPIPPPMRRSTGLLSLRATGAITSEWFIASFDTVVPIAFISSTSVENTLVTFRSLAILSNLCFLKQ